MPEHVVNKGLDVPIAGPATGEAVQLDPPKTVAWSPTEFRGIVPRLAAPEGDVVQAGPTPLFHKSNPDLVFRSPAAGKVVEVRRGARRVITDIVVEIEGDEAESFPTHTLDELKGLDRAQAIAKLLIPGDVTFAWGYGLLTFGLTGLLARRVDGAWRRIGMLVMWAPLAASLLDDIEDVFLHSIVTGLLQQPDVAIGAAVPLLAGVAAVLKYFALIVVTPIYSFAAIVQAVRVDRSWGAWVLYLLVILNCLSLVTRTLQSLPACF